MCICGYRYGLGDVARAEHFGVSISRQELSEWTPLNGRGNLGRLIGLLYDLIFLVSQCMHSLGCEPLTL